MIPIDTKVNNSFDTLIGAAQDAPMEEAGTMVLICLFALLLVMGYVKMTDPRQREFIGGELR